jgi:hypothetical protein
MVVLIATRGGCGAAAASTAEPTPAPTGVALADVAAAQRSALADGTVSRTEYQDAYAAFSQCVSAGGGRLEETDRDPVSGLVGYRTGASLGTPWEPQLGSVEGRCYHDTFDAIEYTFQINDPAVRARQQEQQRALYRDQVRPCLVKNGIDAPEQSEPGTAEFGDWADRWSRLESAHKC